MYLSYNSSQMFGVSKNFFKEINSFIEGVWIKSMKCDTKDFHNFGFYFNFRLHFKIY